MQALRVVDAEKKKAGEESKGAGEEDKKKEGEEASTIKSAPADFALGAVGKKKKKPADVKKDAAASKEMAPPAAPAAPAAAATASFPESRVREVRMNEKKNAGRAE